MPHFTLTLSSQGPIVDAGIMVSAARQQALQAAKLPVPLPQMIRGLIDTGASISGVEPSVLAALGLTPTGEAEIHTPSTGGVPVKTPTYDVRIGIPGRVGDSPFISDTIQVTGTPGLLVQGFHALIGRDILSKCIFHYNGSLHFSLIY